MSNVNVFAFTGNLTSDPELRSLASGTSVCKLRLAVNTRQKVDGEWTEKPNYFDITVWGGQGENAAKYLAKGRPCAVSGRVEWREWEREVGGETIKQQACEFIADNVQFLGSAQDGPAPAAESEPTSEATPSTDAPF